MEMNGYDPDFDFFDQEFARYCKPSKMEVESDETSEPERLLLPVSLRRKLDTLYLMPEDVERLHLPESYPILPDAGRTRLRVLGITDDFKKRLQALDDEVSARRRSLESCSSGDSRRAEALHALASRLYERHYDMLGDDKDLKESIECGREALVICPADDPIKPLILSGLSQCLRQQYWVGDSENIADLDEALKLGGESLDLASGTRLFPEAASQLALAYIDRCHSLGLRQSDDLDRAVQLSYMAVEAIPAGSATRLTPLVSLIRCFFRKYLDTLDVQNLREASHLAEEALNTDPPCENQRWKCHFWLGSNQHALSLHLGEPDNLERATRLLNQTLTLSPFQSHARSLLVSCLTERYSMFLQHDDFELAIANCLYSLQFRSIPTRCDFLHDIGHVFALKYAQYRAFPDLDKSIAYFHCYARLYNPNIERSIGPLSNLCVALSERSIVTKNTQDLEEAHILQQQILPLQSPEAISTVVFADFAQVALARYSLSRSSEAFDEVVYWWQRAGAETTDHGCDSWILPITLATACFIRFEESKNSESLHEARRLYRIATASSKMVSETFRIILDWIREMNCFKFPEEAFDAYTEAIQLLPRIASLGYSQHSRLQILARSSTLSSDSAACALTLGHRSKAVEFLEGGRAVFWSQVLRSRTPLDGLPTKLASRLFEISHQLERGSASDQSGTSYLVPVTEQRAGTSSFIARD